MMCPVLKSNASEVEGTQLQDQMAGLFQLPEERDSTGLGLMMIV